MPTMNDTPEVSAVPETAPPPDVPLGALQADAAPTPAAELMSLQRDLVFFEKWSGKQGRAAQVEARDQKSALLKRLHGPTEPAPAPLPEQLTDAMDNQNDIIKKTAAAMVPANSQDEYKFSFSGAVNMEISEIADLNEIASEASFAAGASPAYARTTVEYVDAALARSDGTPATASDLESAMSRQFGDRKEDIQAHARATIARMPERSQQWIYNTLERLPASDGAWLVNRLSTVNRASGPKN